MVSLARHVVQAEHTRLDVRVRGRDSNWDESQMRAAVQRRSEDGVGADSSTWRDVQAVSDAHVASDVGVGDAAMYCRRKSHTDTVRQTLEERNVPGLHAAQAKYPLRDTQDTQPVPHARHIVTPKDEALQEVQPRSEVGVGATDSN